MGEVGGKFGESPLLRFFPGVRPVEMAMLSNHEDGVVLERKREIY